jgi:hypothetical protein
MGPIGIARREKYLSFVLIQIELDLAELLKGPFVLGPLLQGRANVIQTFEPIDVLLFILLRLCIA